MKTATLAMSSNMSSLVPCIVMYALVQLMVYVATMRAVWLNEYSSRIEFLAQTDAVDIEWRLQWSRKSPMAEKIYTAIELGLTAAMLAFLLLLVTPEIILWTDFLGQDS